MDTEALSKELGFNVAQNTTLKMPPELLIGAPKFHVNLFVAGGSSEEVNIVCCNRLDMLIGGDDGKIAIPQAILYISLPQTKSLIEVLTTHLAKLEKLKEKVDAET